VHPHGAADQAADLHTIVGTTDVMLGQLDRLLAVMSLPRVHLGIIPAHAQYRVPTHNFIIFDDQLVHVETVTAELAVKQPREIALYIKAFATLAAQAVYGPPARALITAELDQLHRGTTA
jgi:hypothetical protein